MLGRLKVKLYDWRISGIHKRHRHQHAADYLFIDEVISRYHANGGLAHPYQHYKLLELRALLDERRPKSILELGSGTTTAVIVDYIRRYPGTQATVIDESEKWLENARTIAKAEGADVSFLVKAKVEDPSRPSTFYADIPDSPYDFVLVDGPSLAINGKSDKSAVNTNILDLIKSKPPATILIDIRRATLEALTTESTGYSVQPSDLITKRVRDGYQYFSIATRFQ